MKGNWLRTLPGVLVLVLVVGVSGNVLAASFPTRDLTFVNMWSAGGTSDLSSRTLAVPMGKILGRTINVTNVVGGSGAIGLTQGAQARPDGYTLTFATSGPTVIQPWMQKVTYDVVNGFVPVAQVFGEYLIVVAKGDAPYNNLKEMVDFFKKAGKTPKFSTGGARYGMLIDSKGSPIEQHSKYSVLAAAMGIKPPEQQSIGWDGP